MDDQTPADHANRCVTHLLQQIASGIDPEIAVQEFDLPPETQEAVVRHLRAYVRRSNALAVVLSGLAPKALIEAADLEGLADYADWLERHQGDDHSFGGGQP